MFTVSAMLPRLEFGVFTKEENGMRVMIKMLSLLVVLVLSVGAASAGCGVKDTVEGTLKSVDAEKNTVVVAGEDGKEVRLTLTAKTEVKDAEGNETEVSKLVGKRVKVVSEHAEIDSIELMA